MHFRPDPPLCREVSIQLASVRTSQQPVRMPLGTRPVSDSFQVSIKERSINRPDDVISRPDARLLKARITIQISPSTRQSTSVRTRLLNRKDFSAKFLENPVAQLSVRTAMPTVQTVPIYIFPNAHLSLQPINKGPWALKTTRIRY